MQWNTTYQESVFSFANNINTHEGGSHMSGFRAALTRTLNRFAREKGHLKEKDENLTGEDVREGLTAIISVKLVRPAVRGPDEDEARQPRDGGLRRVGRQREPRRVPRGEPAGGQRDHPQGGVRARRRARPLARRATSPGASPRSRTRRCPASSPTARSRTRRSPRSSSSRATPPAARRSRAATATRRPCCRCAARSSTSRRAASTRSSRTSRSRRSSRRSGPGVRDEFDIEKARYHKIILMSVDGDEHVLVRDRNGRTRLTRVAEYIDPWLEHAPVSGPQGYKKVLAGQPGELGEVLCVGRDDHEVRFRSIKAVIGHETDEDLFEVTTQYGRSTRVTGNHSLYVLEDGELRKKRGDELAVGDRIAAPRTVRLPETAPERIDLHARAVADSRGGFAGLGAGPRRRGLGTLEGALGVRRQQRDDRAARGHPGRGPRGARGAAALERAVQRRALRCGRHQAARHVLRVGEGQEPADAAELHRVRRGRRSRCRHDPRARERRREPAGPDVGDAVPRRAAQPRAARTSASPTSAPTTSSSSRIATTSSSPRSTTRAIR